ncbi:MAG: DUF434 domain-containing protein [Sulfolobales archaeon]|nr:DUF434 domain-containing protein [Ignisphaera sp.]MCX8199747.1 DUF434 domain-containing protein [Sulfolobales archaeon]MDW8085015.1 DUF434 domain-containing protein [Ignisphaera sp.]
MNVIRNFNNTNESNIRIVDAAYDYRLLLSRGYGQRYALDMVASRYSLNREKKLLLYRCVHSMQYIVNVIPKIACTLEPQGALIIDFYNILLTVLCMLENCDVYLCDDCIVRDLRGYKSRSQDYTYLLKAYDLILNAISQLKPLKIIVVADKNFSHSAIQIERFNKYIVERGLTGYSILSPTPDRDSIEISRSEHAIVASSDSVVVENSYKVFPLTTVITNQLNKEFTINFADLFGTPCSTCYEHAM